MKTFTKQEIRDLLNKVIMDEVSFTRMVEILNERVSERVSERMEIVNERVSEAEDIPEELKKGDLAIFWDDRKEHAFVHVFNKFTSHSDLLPYTGMNGLRWRNAIKFESIEQYERLVKGEI